jgi:cytochrome c oxidase subunit 3
MSLGSINTVVLLGSSLAVALAVHAAQAGRSRSIFRCLLAAIGLGAIFLTIKGIEYYLEFHEHLVPGRGFAFPGDHARAAEMFFTCYFIMTGAHAVHMIIGMGVLAVMAVLSRLGWFTADDHNPLEMAGLYWHFVDIVWIFLYPALYLINPR